MHPTFSVLYALDNDHNVLGFIGKLIVIKQLMPRAAKVVEILDSIIVGMLQAVVLREAQPLREDQAGGVGVQSGSCLGAEVCWRVEVLDVDAG